MIGPVAVLEAADATLAATIRTVAGTDLDLRFAASPDRAGFAAILPGARYAVVRGVRLDADLLERAPDLRMIHQWGTGTDNVPVAEALARGIVVARSPGRNAPSVADMTIGLMLSVLRRIPAADAALRDGTWKMDALWDGARDLSAMTVGLLGYGAIGQAVAQRLHGFGTRVVFHTRSGAPAAGKPDAAAWMSLAEMLGCVDILSLHLPFTPAARGLIGAAELAALRPGAVVINTARGALIDEPALIASLRSGHLGGAGLDVFALEPLGPESPLLKLPNTVLTPHVAGRTADNLTRMVAHWAGNIRAHAAGASLSPQDLVVSA